MTLFTEDFLSQYADFPDHMNELGKFVYYRTYSRYLPEKGRRENWKETVTRSVQYNVSLGMYHAYKSGLNISLREWREEAEGFFDAQYNLRQFLSGRTLWVGGADGGVADKYPLANFNCSYTNIRSFDDLADLFYLLLVGTGVGFKASKQFAEELPAVRDDIEVIHEPFTQRYPLVKEPDTQVFVINEGKKAVLHIGDSKEGWVEGLRQFFYLHTKDEYADLEQIGIFYDYIRPKGSRLHTFGGTASGYEPLKEMFEGITKVFRNEIDSWLEPLERVGDNRVKLRPVHILDIGNLIGNNVVVGGVRRTAEIFLFDADDYESMFAKYGINGIYDESQHGRVIETLRGMGYHKWAHRLAGMPINDPDARPLHHRRMSNNSVAFVAKPERGKLDLIFEMMQMEGEPGFINLIEAARRRLKGAGVYNPTQEQLEEAAVTIGLNPCAEILLEGYGVCNLTTVNVVQFVILEDGKYKLDLEALIEAQKRSVRAGLRMTLVELEIPHWNDVQERDRLIGPSLTGFQDAMEMIGYDGLMKAQLLRELNEEARKEADRYAKQLRVTAPLLVTTVKPEGTISQVANGVSSGLHFSHSPYYIRRVRIAAHDPLAKAAMAHGWSINPEVGQTWSDAKTLVIDFPIASGSKVTKDDVGVEEQFENYFMFQEHYTEHNSSNTVHVKPDEWGTARDIVYDGWDDFVGVSFLAHDGGTYALAPYEAIDKETYDEMKADMKEFDPDILQVFEDGLGSDLDGADGCEGGACPVR